MGQGYIHFGNLKWFVLDEADLMLDMGFIPDIKRIIAQLPSRRQSVFLSATMPPEAVKLANVSQMYIHRIGRTGRAHLYSP